MNLERILEKIILWCEGNGVRLIFGLIIFLLGWKLIKKLRSVLTKIGQKRQFDPTLQSFLNAFIDLSLKALLILFILNFVGVQVTGIAAIFASSTLAIGLALQGSLANFAGGVIILIMRPFKVGDYVEAQGHSGTVERIDMFYTHLVTPDNKSIMIPNGILANGSVVNYSNKNTRRVDLVFGVGYDEDVMKVKSAINSVINSNDLILKDPEPFINIDEHAASSVNFVVKVWTNTENYWTVYYYLLEETKIKFDEENISIPYPQLDIHTTK